MRLLSSDYRFLLLIVPLLGLWGWEIYRADGDLVQSGFVRDFDPVAAFQTAARNAGATTTVGEPTEISGGSARHTWRVVRFEVEFADEVIPFRLGESFDEAAEEALARRGCKMPKVAIRADSATYEYEKPYVVQGQWRMRIFRQNDNRATVIFEASEFPY